MSKNYVSNHDQKVALLLRIHNLFKMGISPTAVFDINSDIRDLKFEVLRMEHELNKSITDNFFCELVSAKDTKDLFYLLEKAKNNNVVSALAQFDTPMLLEKWCKEVVKQSLKQ